MTVRRPLKLDGSNNLQEMSDTDIANIKTEMIRQYGLNPSVTLTVGTGSFGNIADTRLQAGAGTTDTHNFDTEGETPEPTTVTVNYDKFAEAFASLSAPTDTNNKAFPVYQSGGNIHAMTLTDMRDTFVDDVIDTLTTAATTTAQAGTYRVHTASSLAGHTLISATPVFVDTRADTTLYTAGGIYETLDQPITIQNYYLHSIDGASEGAIPTPVQITAANHLQKYTRANFQTILQNCVRYYAAQVAGYKIDYDKSTSGTWARGSGMVDTKLNGSGNWQTRWVSKNDYRAQEFPDGTQTTITTTYLTCQKV